jgi:hypothetical protein
MHSSLSLGVRGVCGSFCTAECFECPRCFRRFASTGEVAESPSMMRQESNAVSACRLQHPLKRTGFVSLFVTLASIATTVGVTEQSPPPPKNTETHVQNYGDLETACLRWTSMPDLFPQRQRRSGVLQYRHQLPARRRAVSGAEARGER